MTTSNRTEITMLHGLFIWLVVSLSSISAKKIHSNPCTSIREIFGEKLPLFEDTVGTPSVVNIQFNQNDFSQYFIEINNKTWLESGETTFRSDGQLASLKLNKVVNTSGADAFGAFNAVTIKYQDTNSKAEFATQFKYYPSEPDLLVFTQSFITGANQTATQDVNGVISSFPSFLVEYASVPLGYAHFGGFMSSAEHPQFGAWNPKGSSTLSGGIVETGPLAIFDGDLNNTIVIAPLTDHMAINDGVSDGTSSPKAFRLGLVGNISSVAAAQSYQFILTLTRQGGGINTAMLEWGDRELQFHGQRRRGNSHERDYTLQYLGYSTDNGAYYYYYTEPGKNYEDTLIDVKAYHDKVGLPTKWALIDSWWYYKGIAGGVKNWTARPDVFPHGLSYLYQQTKWKMQAHNRYWSTDNDYLSTYKFSCSQKSCLPVEYKFWEYLFDINADWGLAVYEQDWLSTSEDSVPRLEYDGSFGRQWLMEMGRSAYEHDISIQYCMSYPRHVMTSVELSSVTQARASDDYHPGNDQWRLGVSSIFNVALDIAPSKDSFWSMPGAQSGHYGNATAEPFNRLQALVLSLSNGPWSFADQIGKSDVELIMKCCNMDGLVLRPDVSATAIDKYILNAAGLDKSSNVLKSGEVWTTTSVIGDPDQHQFRYYYVLSVELTQTFALYPSYLNHYRRENGYYDTWIAYEANSTDTYAIVNETSPLMLQKSDKYSFEYYRLVPLLNRDMNAFYLQGEIGKWISVSKQRFKEIVYFAEDEDEATVSVKARIEGVVGETVSIAFVQYPQLKQVIVECTIGETQEAVIQMPDNTCYTQ
eukprot:340133_1